MSRRLFLRVAAAAALVLLLLLATAARADWHPAAEQLLAVEARACLEDYVPDLWPALLAHLATAPGGAAPTAVAALPYLERWLGMGYLAPCAALDRALSSVWLQAPPMPPSGGAPCLLAALVAAEGNKGALGKIQTCLRVVTRRAVPIEHLARVLGHADTTPDRGRRRAARP